MVVAGLAVAASVILAAGLWLRPSSPDCVAYIGGERYTDRNLIMAQVQSTMGELAEAKEAVSVESQMQGLFN